MKRRRKEDFGCSGSRIINYNEDKSSYEQIVAGCFEYIMKRDKQHFWQYIYGDNGYPGNYHVVCRHCGLVRERVVVRTGWWGKK